MMTSTAAAALLLLTACGEDTDPASTTSSDAAPETAGSDTTATTASNDVAVTYVVTPSVDGDSDELLSDAEAILTERLARTGLTDARITTGGTSDEGTLRIEFAEEPDPSVLEEVLLPAAGQFRPVILASPPGATQQSSPDEQQGEQPPEMSEVDQATLDAFLGLDCTEGADWPPESLTAAPDEPTIACASGGTEKFLLEPAVHIPAAAASATPPEGTASVWSVELTVTTEGTEELRIVTERLAPTQGRLAYLAEGAVITAPSVNSPIAGGQLMASGYDEEGAEDLATWFRLSGHHLTFDTVEVISN